MCLISVLRAASVPDCVCANFRVNVARRSASAGPLPSKNYDDLCVALLTHAETTC